MMQNDCGRDNVDVPTEAPQMGRCIPKVDKNGEIVYEVFSFRSYDRIVRYSEQSAGQGYKFKPRIEPRTIKLYATTKGFCGLDYNMIC